MENVTITRKASMEFYEGTLEGKKVVVVRSGIGKVNAGICAQILADVFQAEVILNTGIAGSLNKEINIGDIVISTDVLQHDVDAVAFGYEKGQIPQMDVMSFQADEALRRLAVQVCKEVNPEIQVFEGRIASGVQPRGKGSHCRRIWRLCSGNGRSSHWTGCVSEQNSFPDHPRHF